jgi:hypothetical protein
MSAHAAPPVPKRVQKLHAAPWKARAGASRAVRKHLDAQDQITPHFTWAEFASQGAHKTPVPANLRPNTIRLCWLLEKLRHQLGDVGGMSHARHIMAQRRERGRDVEPLQRHQVRARPLAQSDVADAAQTQPPAEPPLALARAARDRAHTSRVAAQQRHHAIGFAVIDGAQQNRRGHERSQPGLSLPRPRRGPQSTSRRWLENEASQSRRRCRIVRR